MKILFLCRGNVGRSQMAEFLARKMFGNKHEFISAGTKLSGPEEPLCNVKSEIQGILDAMQEEGIDISQAVRKQVTEDMANSCDKVIAILEDDELPSYLLDSPKVIRWTMLDPKGRNTEEARMIKDQIKSLILAVGL